jgi:hypothetical protein
MYKRPLPKRVVRVDPSMITYAPIENSIVYKLLHGVQCSSPKPKPYEPIFLVEDIVSWVRHRGASDEEINEIRRKNHYVPSSPDPHPKKTHKKKKAVGDDIDKVFSQFTTKPTVVKKKVLKAVVKKI